MTKKTIEQLKEFFKELDKNLNHFSISDYIYSDEQLNIIFNHHNQKYTLKELLLLLIKILYNNIPYREIKNYTHIHWCTIYNFHMKLIQYDIFKRIHNSGVNNYLSKLDKSTKLL